MKKKSLIFLSALAVLALAGCKPEKTETEVPTVVDVKETECYRNKREKFEPCMELVDMALAAIKNVGLEPVVEPIRGGTDGARLSFMGLPCPNLCTGGANYHGRFEYACIEQMELCVEILKKIVEKYAVKEI